MWLWSLVCHGNRRLHRFPFIHRPIYPVPTVWRTLVVRHHTYFSERVGRTHDEVLSKVEMCVWVTRNAIISCCVQLLLDLERFGTADSHRIRRARLVSLVEQGKTEECFALLDEATGKRDPYLLQLFQEAMFVPPVFFSVSVSTQKRKSRLV